MFEIVDFASPLVGYAPPSLFPFSRTELRQRVACSGQRQIHATKIIMNGCTGNSVQWKKAKPLLQLSYGGLGFFCICGIGFALYMQHYELASPCPLCIFQRIALMACGALSLLAAWLPSRRLTWLWPSLIVLAALSGAAISIRHIQIQESLASAQALSCGAGLEFLVQTRSLPDVIASVLSGHGDCTVIDWQLGFLTLPMVALASFVSIIFWSVLIGFCQNKYNTTLINNSIENDNDNRSHRQL